jgi:hypothetical protein
MRRIQYDSHTIFELFTMKHRKDRSHVNTKIKTYRMIINIDCSYLRNNVSNEFTFLIRNTLRYSIVRMNFIHVDFLTISLDMNDLDQRRV